MYHSTIKPRTRPITADDFKEAANHGLSLSGRENAPDQLDKWNRYVPVKPLDLARVFSDINLADMQVEVDIIRDKTIRFNLSDKNKAIDNIAFGFELGEEKKLLYSKIELKQRRQGLGTRVFKARIEATMALGVPSFSFGAGLSHGGLVWARRGFETDCAYYKEKPASLYYLGKAIRGRLLLVKDRLPEDVYEECRDLSGLSDPDDITRLAHQDHVLTLDADDFDLRNIYRHSMLAQAFAQAGLSGDDGEDRGMDAELRKVRVLVQEAADAGMPVRLGQFLLYGSEWRARLDFSDERQMQKLEAHMGPFRTIVRDEPALQRVTGSGYRKVLDFAP